LGAITVVLGVLATLGALGKKSGAIAALVLVLILAIASLVTFLMTVSGMQEAIRNRRDPSEAFT